MPVYFDGKDGWISLRLIRFLYPAVVTYLGNLPKDVVIYNHYSHYASQRSRSKLFGKSTLVLCSAASTPVACIELFPCCTRKHFHERLYVHVSNILIHLAPFLYRIRNRRSDGAHCSLNFAQHNDDTICFGGHDEITLFSQINKK